MAEWEELNDQITSCRRCARLVAWREEVASTRRRAYRDQEYWGRPVTGFGDRRARVLVVGLAPGAHGSNRTGRVFTGDGSGDFLFRALHAAGFANQPNSKHSQDGLALADLYISAVCRCAPPANKPTSEEIQACLPYLAQELELMAQLEVIVVLGRIAFDNLLRLLRDRGHDIPRLLFSHGQVYDLGTGLPRLIASYHPSLQNTQTGRLTPDMFAGIWEQTRQMLSDGGQTASLV